MSSADDKKTRSSAGSHLSPYRFTSDNQPAIKRGKSTTHQQLQRLAADVLSRFESDPKYATRFFGHLMRYPKVFIQFLRLIWPRTWEMGDETRAMLERMSQAPTEALHAIVIDNQTDDANDQAEPRPSSPQQ